MFHLRPRLSSRYTALNLTLHEGARYPLRTLAPLAAAAGLLALVTMRLLRNDAGPPEARAAARAAARSPAALSG